MLYSGIIKKHKYMAKIIKTATVKKPRAKRSFKVGESVKWSTIELIRNGCFGEINWVGEIVKVRPTTVHCMDKDGDIWSVNKKEVYNV
jgi:hypothetical protein